MREYSITVIADPGIEFAKEYLAMILDGKKGWKIKDEGVKKLTYTMDGYNEGAYLYATGLVLTQYESKLLSKVLNAEKWCIRYLICKIN